MTPITNSQKSFETVCVIGLGYIGLPTAAFIASRGMNVIGVDINAAYVQEINAGKVPFHEPGFESLLMNVVMNGRLRAETSPREADAFIVAVPTPFKEDHSIDTAYIRSAASSFAPHLKPGALVILESTSPPGTTERMAEFIIKERPDLSLNATDENRVLVAHCPERVLPGRIMAEMEENDRVIGGLTPEAAEAARELYGSFCSGEMLITNAATAEMAKLTENSFRDVNIAFANELSLICDQLNINVWELIELANHHPRVNILQPGPGVGGHCIAVDPWFIVSSAPDASRLIKTAREINDGKPSKVVDKVLTQISKLETPSIAALGITFKADIDDLRESPSLYIVQQLADQLPSAHIHVVEPNISVLPKALAIKSNVTLSAMKTACDDADLILLLVDHAEFKQAPSSWREDKIIIDTKGVWN